jgi:hypothetical protein
MLRITSEHLNSIFDTIGIEITNSVEALVHLDPQIREERNQRGDVAESQVDMILNPALLTYQFFSARRDVPDDRQPEQLHQFQETATFTAKLSLLTIACTPSDENNFYSLPDSHAIYAEYAAELMNQADQIFAFQNADAELYLLIKIKEWLRAEFFATTPELKQRIQTQLDKLFLKACMSVWKMSQDAKLPGLVDQYTNTCLAYFADNGHKRDQWLDEFVIQACVYYGTQDNLVDRAQTVESIYRACDPLKDRINPDLMLILLEFAVAVNDEFETNNSLWSAASHHVSQYFNYLYANVGLWALAETSALGLSGFSQFIASQLNKAYIYKLEFAKEFMNISPNILAKMSANEKNIYAILAKQVFDQLRDLNIDDAIASAYSMKNMISIANYVMPLVVTGCVATASYTLYKSSRFFQPRAELKPVMPAWLQQAQEQAKINPNPLKK